VNGDGYSDVLVGSPAFDSFQHDGGAAFLKLGNEGRGGWTRAPRQRTGSRPVALLDRAESRPDFRIRLELEGALGGLARQPPTGLSARLEWEVAPLGVPLDGSAIQSGTPQAWTGAPLAIDELAEFGPLPVNRPFHWRARAHEPPALPGHALGLAPGQRRQRGQAAPRPARARGLEPVPAPGLAAAHPAVTRVGRE
jgi:hypothetical protein